MDPAPPPPKTRITPMPNEHLEAFMRSQGIRYERCCAFEIKWEAGTVCKVTVTLHQSKETPDGSR